MLGDLTTTYSSDLSVQTHGVEPLYGQWLSVHRGA
jgi:hypothetical protein